MKDRKNTSLYPWLIGMVFILLIQPGTLMAAVETIPPGEKHDFSEADDGKKACYYYSLGIYVPAANALCGNFIPPWAAQLPPYTNTGYNAAKNRVSAAYSNAYIPDPTNLAGPAHYASSAVYNDFKIDGPEEGGGLVDTQIAITYSLSGGILGGFSYDGEISVGLTVEDITDPSNPMPVGTLELFKKDRSGDQGLTDIAMGATQVALKGETARYIVKLRKGNTYRVWFGAQAFATTPLISGAEVSINAYWSELRVDVDEDENIAELLAQHDAEIKAAIAAHDSKIETVLDAHDLKIETALDSHDQDIKALLAQIQAQLVEIKQLLLTPPGRREGYPLKPFKSKGRKFPPSP